MEKKNDPIAIDLDQDYAFLLAILPEGWREKAKELGALRRCRKVPDAERLLRVLLIHLAEGCSLRETALRAREGGIAQLSDVAIMDRLRLAQPWFEWLNRQLMARWISQPPEAVFSRRWNVRLVDGTRIKEPGPTGSSFCLHYSIRLPTLTCDEILVSEAKGEGESFCRFAVKPGDLVVGDRAYGVRPGIFHVAQGGGDVLVRFALSNLPLEAAAAKPFELLRRLRGLRGRQLGDWPAWVRDEHGRTLAGRVIAVRKSSQAAEQGRQHVRRQAQKNGCTVQPETLEAAGYVFVFTTARRQDLSATQALEMYRGRWQIELVFKRLKSILGLGHLHKSDPESAKAWLQGKLLVALLIEGLIRCGEAFSPWGFPLEAESAPVAGGAIHAAFAVPDPDPSGGTAQPG